MAEDIKIYGAKGGSQKQHQPVEQEDNLISLNKVKVLLAVADGEVDSNFSMKDLYLADVPVQNQDGSYNYEGVRAEFRPGTQYQDYIAGLDGANSEVQVSREIKNDTPYIIAVNNTQLSAIRVKLYWPRLVKQESNGDLNGTTCEYAIDLSVNGGAYQEYTRGVANGKTTTGYDRSIRVNLPAEFDSALVRIRKITPDSTSSTLVNGMQITTYQEVIDAKFRYPLTALVYVEFGSDLFPNGIPTISIKKRWKLIQVPTNYDPETRTYSGTWNGLFKMAWSNNPAWVLYDLVTNRRYGLDQRELGVEIDKWGLYEAAQFCDQMVPDGKGGMEPRYLCDMVVQNKVEAYTLIRDICSIFRGLTFYDGEKIGIVVDKPRNPSYIFTNDNVVNGLFSRTFASDKSLYTTANVQFDDVENNYQQDVEPVFELEATRRFGFNPVDLTAIGCTRRSEANRRGRWLLKTNLRSETISFTTGLEGMIPMIGEVIAVNDAAWSSNYQLNLSGRIESVQGLQVFTPFKVDAAPGDRILLNKPDGSPEARTIASVSEDGRTINLNTAFSFVAQPDTVFAIDKDNLALQQYVVTGIQKADSDGSDSFQYTITAVEYDPNKYDEIDYGVNIVDRPTSIVEPDRLSPPENLTVSSYSKVVQGLSVETMVIGWDKAPYAKTYNVQWRKENGNWINVPRTASTEVDIEGIYAGIYDVRVRSVSDTENVSSWSGIVTKSLTGKIGKPEPLALITASDDEVFGIRVKWGFADGSGDTSYTELQQVPDNGDGTYSPENASLLTLVPYPQFEYWHTTLPAGKVIWYRGRTIDRIGNVSQWTDFVRGMASDDVSAIIGEIKVDIENSDGYKFLANGIEQNRAEIERVDDEVAKASENALNATNEAENAKLQAMNALRNASQAAEGIIENALSVNENTKRIIAESGERRAQYVEVVNVIASETEARVEQAQQLTSQFNERINSEVTTLNQTIANNDSSYAQRFNGINSSLGEVKSSITSLSESLSTETEARANDVSMLQASINKNSASISENSTAISNETTSRVQQYNDLNARVGGVESSVDSVTTAIANERDARISDISTLKASIDGNSASITNLNDVISNDIEPSVRLFNQASANYSSSAEAIIENAIASDKTRRKSDANYTQLVTITAKETEARVEALTQLKAQIDDEVVSQLANVQTAISTETEARATADTQLSARLGENESALNQKLDSYATVEGIGVQYGVRLGLKYNGQTYSSGMSMELVGTGGNVRSQFIFDANRFAISNGIGSGSGHWQLPFVVENGNVIIQSAVIGDGSISNAKIGNFIQSNNYVANAAGWRLDKGGTFENYGSDGDGAMKQTNTTISVRDANGRLRVQIGKLTGTW